MLFLLKQTWAIAFIAVVSAVEIAVATKRLVKAEFTISAAEPGGQVAPLQPGKERFKIQAQYKEKRCILNQK